MSFTSAIAQRLGKHAVELVPVADVDLLELEPVGFRDRSEVFKIARVGELVHHAHGILCVVDAVSGNCRPDESGSASDDDAVHEVKNLWLVD